MASEYGKRITPADHSRLLTPHITPRELEVLQLIKLGRTIPEIAQELFISTRTAKNHVEHIDRETGCFRPYSR
jgi:DNA-binding CsgD family transcriptional regulator